MCSGSTSWVSFSSAAHHHAHHHARAPLTARFPAPEPLPFYQGVIEGFKLPRISAVIEAGAVIALTGSGGSGKTTLLRVLARQMEPEAG